MNYAQLIPEVDRGIAILDRIAGETLVAEIKHRINVSDDAIVMDFKYKDTELSTSFSLSAPTRLPEDVIRQHFIRVAMRFGEVLFVRPPKD